MSAATMGSSKMTRKDRKDGRNGQKRWFQGWMSSTKCSSFSKVSTVRKHHREIFKMNTKVMIHENPLVNNPHLVCPLRSQETVNICNTLKLLYILICVSVQVTVKRHRTLECMLALQTWITSSITIMQVQIMLFLF